MAVPLEATTVNVTAAPAETVWLWGWVVMEGSVVAASHQPAANNKIESAHPEPTRRLAE